MRAAYCSRFLRYIKGYFPEEFQVEVEISQDPDDRLLIKIVTPEGSPASYETTVAQALDVMAMGSIAALLKARVQ
ncbi:hypothetical protein [Ectopseudomonas oleovorans]|uniref:hypothetical protein n=1 Tax=Ectopseudomonas oleovorans TaxID=301 RepID=UPI0011C0653A|nr:hypothetical protein [Pseudomonas oleovorans]